MADIFISYSHQDRQLAHDIADYLISVGASVWWDRELIAGEDFDSTILRELTTAPCVIVIWTEVSISSRYVRGEANEAASKNKLLPITCEGVQPPLGLRAFHQLQIRSDGIADPTFVRSLRRAVEERLDKTLKQPNVSKRKKPKRSSSSKSSLTFEQLCPLIDCFKAIAVTADCVWLGSDTSIEVRDLRNGAILSRQEKPAESLFSLPNGNSVVGSRIGWGYHSPDTISIERWSLSASLAQIRQENEKAAKAVPDYDGWHTQTREDIIRKTHLAAIERTDLFHTYSRRAPKLAISEDGQQIYIRVDDPEDRIEIRSIIRPTERGASVKLVGCHSSKVLILPDNNRLVAAEFQEETGSTRLSVWDIHGGSQISIYDLDYKTVNAMCRTADDNVVALGLDQSVSLFHLPDGRLEGPIEIDSRPVQACAYNRRMNLLGVVTNTELALIDLAEMRTLRTMKHLGLDGLACDLNAEVMVALVVDEKNTTNLAIWRFSEQELQARNPLLELPTGQSGTTTNS